MLKIATTVASGLMLAGCVMPTKQPVPSDISPIPMDRVFLPAAPTGNAGEVIVTRDVGLIGSKCLLGLLVDGKTAAHVGPAERVPIQLAAGRHTLTVSWIDGRGLCGAFFSEERAESRRRSIEIIVDPGQSRQYRIHTNTDGESTIEPTL